MTTAEQNYLLLQEIEANRRFILMAYQQNPKLLKNAEARIKQMFEVTAPREPDEVNPAGMRKQRGVSLIELIMFIVIISIAVTGILLVMNKVTGHSADTLVRKQALAIAESLLEEVELMPFTYCDPDDVNAATASGVAGCATTPEGPGPETIAGVTEDRYGGANPTLVNAYFDNVSDYGGAAWGVPGFTMNGSIKDITGAVNASLSSYSVSVTVGQQALGGIAASESLLITVTADHPGCEMHPCITLNGYRTRYAPNDLP